MKLKFLSKFFVMLFIISTIGGHALASQPVQQSLSTEPTCSCQEERTELTQREALKIAKLALLNPEIQSAITNFENQGFALDLSQVGGAKNENGIIIGITLINNNGEYAYIFYNNSTQQVNTISELDIDSITNPEMMQPMLCSQCILTCIAMIQVPVLFIACMSVCGGGFC